MSIRSISLTGGKLRRTPLRVLGNDSTPPGQFRVGDNVYIYLTPQEAQQWIETLTPHATNSVAKAVTA